MANLRMQLKTSHQELTHRKSQVEFQVEEITVNVARGGHSVTEYEALQQEVDSLINVDMGNHLKDKVPQAMELMEQTGMPTKVCWDFGYLERDWANTLVDRLWNLEEMACHKLQLVTRLDEMSMIVVSRGHTERNGEPS